MIVLFDKTAQDYSTNGLMVLDKYTEEATISEELNGEYELEIVFKQDAKLTGITNGMVLRVPAPIRETPAINMYETVGNEIWKVKDSYGLRLRTGPGTSYKTLATYKKNAEVIVIEKTNASWYKVVTKDGKTGYMSTTYLEYVRTEYEPPVMTGAIAPGRTKEQLFRIYNVGPGFDGKTIKAHHVFYDLGKNHIITAETQNINGVLAMQRVLTSTVASHDFKGFSDIAKSGSIEAQRKSPLEAIVGEGGIIDTFGGEILRDNFDIFHTEHIGYDRGVSIAYRKNMTDFQAEFDDSDVVTRIIPTGLNADDTPLYLDSVWVDSVHIGDYEGPRIKEMEYRDVKVGSTDYPTVQAAKNKLLLLAQEQFAAGIDLPEMQATVDYVDMANILTKEEFTALTNVFLGDTIRVKYELEGLQFDARVVAYSWDCLRNEYESIELGSKKASIANVTMPKRMIPDSAISGRKLAMPVQAQVNNAQATAFNAQTIANGAATAAANAATAASNAQTTANNAATNATTANNLLNDLASDSKLTAVEKQSAKTEWDIIISEKAKIDAQADVYGVSKTAYATAYNSLSTYITPLLSSLTTTSDITGDTFRSTFKAYYDARQDILNAISTAAKTLADAAQSTAQNLSTRGLGMKVNYATFSGANPGELYLHGYNSNGVAADVNGFVVVNGANFAVPKQQVNPNVLVSKSYLALDSGTGICYMLSVNESTGAWTKYPGGAAVTLSSQYIFIGYAEMSDAETFTYATLWNNILGYKQITDVYTASAAAAAAQTTANTAVSSAATANNLLTDLASDSKLTAVEKQSTKNEWDIIISEKVKIDAQADVYGVPKAAYATAYDSLSTYITPLLSSLTTTSDITGATFRATFKAYYDARQDILNAISTAAKTLADAAQGTANGAATAAANAATAAGNAQTTANTAATNATTANNLLNDLASDSKLTAVEKQSTKNEWDIIVSEKVKIDAQADVYGVSKTAYATAYNSLSTYITPLLSSLTTTSNITGATFRSTFKAYYDARQDILNAISTAAKTLADAAQGTANNAYQRVTGVTIQEGLVEIIGAVIRMITGQMYVSNADEEASATLIIDTLAKVVRANAMQVKALDLVGNVTGINNILLKGSLTTLNVSAGSSLPAVVSAIPKYLETNLTIYVALGTYTLGDFVIENFLGSHLKIVFAAGVVLNATSFIKRDNPAGVSLVGNSAGRTQINILGNTARGIDCLRSGGEITNLRVTGRERTGATDGLQTGMYFESCDGLYVHDNVIERTRVYTICVIKGGGGLITNNAGGQVGGNYATLANLGDGILAINGAAIAVTETVPIAALSSAIKWAAWLETYNLTPTASPGSPSTPTTQTVKYIYNSSAYCDLPSSAGMGSAASSWPSGAPRGGLYTSQSKRYAGMWLLKLEGGAVQNILTGLAGKTIVSANLTLHCDTYNGSPGGAHDLYYLLHNVLPPNGASPASRLTDTGLNLSPADGTSQTLNVTDWLQSMVNAGTAFFGFGLGTGGTYARYDMTCSLEITYQL